MMLLTEAFPIRDTSPAEPKPYFYRESGRHITDLERYEKLSDHAKCDARCKASAG